MSFSIRWAQMREAAFLASYNRCHHAPDDIAQAKEEAADDDDQEHNPVTQHGASSTKQ